MGWNVIVDTFLSLGTMAENMFDLLEKAIIIVTKLVEFFFIIINPNKLLKDIFYGIINGIKTLFNALSDILFGNIRKNIISPPLESDTSSSKKSGICSKPTLLSLILLVLCPPLALFTHMGFSGLFQVIIASVLTCLFYFPGLIYASLILI